MNIVSRPLDIRQSLDTVEGQIGFVPTMGALHEGHLSLIREAKRHCAFVVVSIFVNPTQFGQNEDLDRYPRTLEKDKRLLEKEGVDLLFTPTASDIYHGALSQNTTIAVPGLSERYCGKTRPQFFSGVCSVVHRLFSIVRPNKAFFGEKDFQQYLIIKKMVSDLFLDVQVCLCPLIRESSGLALSSRNAYFSATQREEASKIFMALSYLKTTFTQGETDSRILISKTRNWLKSYSSISIDYLVIVDPETLDEVSVVSQDHRILFAGYLNSVRLIDTLPLS